jgi:(2R)-sulfolactate sulfo-lyase subunit alpha
MHPSHSVRNMRGEKMINFLVHEKSDSVGVATVDIKAGENAEGLFMDSQESLQVKIVSDIPLGHKIALKDFKVGDTVIKYGHDIGKVTADIRTGEHVHTQNLRTKRW